MYTKYYLKVNGNKVAYFEYPTGQKLQGVTLFCHGFPGAYRLQAMAQPLNKHGYTLEEINYRGDAESEGTFSFLGSVEDIVAMVKYLREKFPDRPITGLGYSAGGFYMLNAVRELPDLFDKIILLNPLLDFSFTQTPIMRELWQEAASVIELNTDLFYVAEIAKVLEHHNPIDFAAELKPKIHIVQGEQDQLLPLDIVKKFHALLRHPGRLIWVPGMGHAFRGNEPELINALIHN